MRAVGFTKKALPIEDPRSLLDLELPDPGSPQGHDLLVRVRAVSVNPRDMKSRMTMEASAEKPVVLGYDASGVVEAVGPDCTLFRPGDEVMYAGVLDRLGSNAELQLVDERIVGRKPRRLEHAQAASLPLTALTAYEMLFDRMRIPRDGESAGNVLLVVGGAGGVPSIAIQLARALTELTVVATASRPESAAWVRQCGAHHVVDHSRPLPAQMKALDAGPCPWIFSTHTDTARWAEMAQILAPQGSIGLIDDPEPLDLRLLKFKSAAVHWEAMFTRPMFRTRDMVRQHEILDEVADLVDAGKLRATTTRDYGSINAANLRTAHAAIETGRAVGKIVLSGF
ncbi:zinc-binding alcohol dehydrogenase family protein [Paracraurococcus lichenis]|uniref:Zinc-type alcohol dehydrogenase-like protein n=1 Tax=Paracraurococcus lichenis TaxID=3064888 RepID=A0ABT9DTI2_9PROT|nr:zinc-binding alcohol dehydrogenase family protein [Paracraurococcus sp. LOR1-02]MDO9707213.1 zinc-binding alcohol dehydrogenase family protein [Paracraurococcus sp. LOR1-02]